MKIDSKIKETLDLRLVNGEINVEEYEKLIDAMSKPDVIEKNRQSYPAPSQRMSPPQQQTASNDMATAMRLEIARSKSYVGSACLTLLFYWIFYPVGLVLNFVYLSDAGNNERVSGRSPSGKGCLLSLLWWCFILPVIFTVGLLILAAVYGMSLPEIIHQSGIRF